MAICLILVFTVDSCLFNCRLFSARENHVRSTTKQTEKYYCHMLVVFQLLKEKEAVNRLSLCLSPPGILHVTSVIKVAQGLGILSFRRHKFILA